MTDRATIQDGVIQTLLAITSDWDMDDVSGDIDGETRLVQDLSFESIELVQLMLALEKQFGLKKLASESLLTRDGKVVPDLQVKQIVDFLDGVLNAS